jgi:hypothetical protein
MHFSMISDYPLGGTQAPRPMAHDSRFGILRPNSRKECCRRRAPEILAVLKPFGLKSETASRLRGRIEKVLAFAETKGWRPEGKNPARWRNGLDTVLPPAGKLKAAATIAMSYSAVPFFH